MHRARPIPYVLAALLLAACDAGPPFPPPAEWVSAATRDGRMTARFPARPETRTETAESPLGTMTMRFLMHETRHGAFTINQISYPVDPADFDVAGALEGATQGAVAESDGTLDRMSEIEVAGFSGRELVVHLSDGRGKVRQRMVIDPATVTLFQAIVAGPGEFVHGGDAEAFLDSVEIQ